MKPILFSLLFFLMSVTVNAQIERSIFDAYDVSEINQIKLNLADEGTNVQTWPGDNILVEANIAFYDGTKSIFENLIKNGRYTLEANRTSATLTLSGVTKTPIGSTKEVIERTIYIPECYALSGGVYSKSED